MEKVCADRPREGASQFCKYALIPQPLLPSLGEGEQDLQSPSPLLGEGFRVRDTKVRCTLTIVIIAVGDRASTCSINIQQIQNLMDVV